MEISDLKSLIRMRLADCGYPQSAQTDATIGRLCSLPKDSQLLLMKWLKNDEPVVFSSIQGIDSSFLREQLNMKEPAIIIAHQMLKADPIGNASYFRRLAITKR